MNFWTKAAALLTAIGAGCLLFTQGTHAQITPAPRFGAVETYHEPEMADAAGVGWTRIIFYWSELEREGPDDWNEFHAPIPRIEREIAGGREVVGLIQSTPAWATDGSPEIGVPRGLYLPVDDPDNLWANFIREVVSRYDGLVEHWVIWNEPDIDVGDYGALWEGSPADYYRLLKVAYLAAHEVNADVTIHLGGTTYWHDPAWLEAFLTVASEDPDSAENGYFFDVVTLHIYFRPETTRTIVTDTRRTLAAFGLEKPIWINETNAMPFDDPEQPWEDPVFLVTQEMQAAFLLQQFALALALDVERIALYKWVEEPARPPGFEPFAVIRHSRSTTPAYEAFKVITAHYAGTERALLIERPDVMQVILQRGEQTTRIFWARTQQPVVIDAAALADSALYVQPDGQTETLTAQNSMHRLELPGATCLSDDCLMGGMPLVLVEEAAVDLSALHSVVTRTVSLGDTPAMPSQGRQVSAGVNGLALNLMTAAAIMVFGFAFALSIKGGHR